jgi:hypothetical protein
MTPEVATGIDTRLGGFMTRATTRPNVPVFVSSTFVDLQVYRRKIQDALTQLEAIVRGMEQFGSKPGTTNPAQRR